MRTNYGLRTQVLGWLLIVLAACSSNGVQWSDASYSAAVPPRGVSPQAIEISFDACPQSIRGARSAQKLFAAWWTVRRDSSAVLFVARSDDGGKDWNAPVIADSTDRSVRGCGRPPPAIAADSATGYVHLAYYAEPSSGHGVFFAHSMDGGRTFHAVVPIVFGDTPAWVAVAAEGDRVAVAYEDPNSVQPTVGVALSNSMGHLFRQGEIVSGVGEIAKQPTVALHGDTVGVWWSDHSPDPRISATRAAYRSGVWQ